MPGPLSVVPHTSSAKRHACRAPLAAPADNSRPGARVGRAWMRCARARRHGAFEHVTPLLLLCCVSIIVSWRDGVGTGWAPRAGRCYNLTVRVCRARRRGVDDLRFRVSIILCWRDEWRVGAPRGPMVHFSRTGLSCPFDFGRCAADPPGRLPEAPPS